MKYTAKFSTETKTRKSPRIYTHAVGAINTRGAVVRISYSGSLALAQKKASSEEFTRYGYAVEIVELEVK